MTKWKLCLFNRKETDEVYDIPDEIIANLTRECGGNVHDWNIVNVTCGSL
jgi:hypothetical protein